MYGNDKCAAIVLALLKQYGVRKVVASPGSCNRSISAGITYDPFFEVYSVVDERSAAYFATGLAFESGEPVVISCTGATASRNYLSALTEAYYRNIPIIALTAQVRPTDLGNLVDQTLDRTISQNDVKLCSVILPAVKDKKDEEQCTLQANKAILTAIKKRGPVHIDIPVESWNFTRKTLPDVSRMELYDAENLILETAAQTLCERLMGRKVAVFIGAHSEFDPRTLEAINRFAEKYGAAVFYDHTSNYHGKNAVLAAVASELAPLKSYPEIVVDIGSVTGVSSAPDILLRADCFWRISETGGFHCRYGKTSTCHFEMSEYCFFHTLSTQNPGEISEVSYFSQVSAELSPICMPELPLSNTYICQCLSTRLPKNCTLGLGIKNSLRNMDYFPLHPSISAVANVGGFGIDGALSTIIGQSMAFSNRLYFAVMGDLAFFYDMNALGIRHIQKNLRLLVVNNRCGVEMVLNRGICRQLSVAARDISTGKGHFGSVQTWAESMGFEYMSADTKERFLEQVGAFCAPDLDVFDRPVIFEVFVQAEDDQKAVFWMRAANKDTGLDMTRVKALLDERKLGELVVLFGAGALGQTVSDQLAMEGLYPDYICDNAEDQWGNALNGVEVIGPERLSMLGETHRVSVVIASKFREEIGAQLAQMGITSVM